MTMICVFMAAVKFPVTERDLMNSSSYGGAKAVKEIRVKER